MSGLEGTILVIDHDREMCALIEDLLGKEGYAAESVQDGDLALRFLEERSYDLLICSPGVGEISGPDLLQRVRALVPQQMVIMIADPEAVEPAIEAMKGGAFDYVVKPFKPKELIGVVQKAFDRVRLKEEVICLRQGVPKEYRFSGIIGKSQEMQAIFRLIRRVAEGPVNILIAGESGTGKEMVARAIHDNSPRKERSFIAVSCAAIPTNLLESELFGHVRGAFTDARVDKKGMFEEAHGGTLFLDEIGEIPVTLQAKLLRAIEEKAIRRVGSTKTIPVDIRIVSATNRDLMEEVKARQFRDDLYYRINELEIGLPPLRRHREDIPLLADHFLIKYADSQGRQILGFTKSAMNVLVDYPWPGNVRELENAVKHAVTLARGGRISAEDLPSAMTGRQGDQLLLDQALAKMIPLEDLEREYIQRVLQRVGGNKRKAARVLQIDRRTLYRKIGRSSKSRKEEILP